VDYGEIISSRASGTTDQNYTVVQIEDGNPTNNLYSRSLATDGTNGTPRTGLTTHGPESVGHLYLWGQAYTA
jgi:hypothetical protein